MSLAPYNGGPPKLIESAYELAGTIIFHTHELYYWLRYSAPTIVQYSLIQLGRNGIDRLPFLSWDAKREIKRWLDELFFGY